MKTGDRVICIRTHNGGSKPPPLVKGREYIIYDVHKCGCGNISFDVGLTSNNVGIMCRKCSSIYSLDNAIHWAAETLFAKVKEQYKVIHMDIEVEEPILN